MATYDFRKKQKGTTGQIIRLSPNNNIKHEMEERVVKLESKIDKILSLLEDRNKIKND